MEENRSSENTEQSWVKKYRRRLLIGGPIVFIALSLVVYCLGGRYVATDDAYLQAGRVEISSNVSGQVVAVKVKDNQKVHTGEELFVLDNQPFKIAVAEAQAELAAARLEVMGMKASYKQCRAQMHSAYSELAYQKGEMGRKELLKQENIVSQAKLDKVKNDFKTAYYQYEASRQQCENVLASLGGNPNIKVESHPKVMRAQAQLEHALLNLSYTKILAPLDGIVSKVELLQVGDYIKAAQPVFSLIAINDLWVEANFKETEMTYIRPGQPASISIDTYPDKELKGRVVSVSPGTGSTFSLLPPENSTGNWVKVVQRIPVRISISHPDPTLPMHSGSSVIAEVDTGHNRLFNFKAD